MDLQGKWVWSAVGAVVVLFVGKMLMGSKKKPIRKKGVIYYYSLPSVWGQPSASPFCTKLETWMKLAKIPYEIDFPMQPGSKGKWPYIELNGEIISDSTIIIERLTKEFNVTIDSSLSPVEQAISLAYQRAIEEHLYFGVVYIRWIENFSIIRPLYFKTLPWLLRYIIPTYLVLPKVKQSLYGQGMSRYSRDEITKKCLDDLKSISVYLGNKPYFFGNEPRTIDVIIYSFVSSLVSVPLDDPVKEGAKKMDNLIAHCNRINSLVWQK